MLYVVMLVTLTTGLIHHIKVGKIYTSLINFGIALCIDQVKSLPVHFVIYWIVIRRCNKYDVPNFEVWDDDIILLGGSELSLFQWMRFQVRSFLENYYINKLILVMTLILCGVIFTELAIQDQLDNPAHPLNKMKSTFTWINIFLITFFVLEITMKLFGYFMIFLSEFINVFDSIVVLISFAFLFNSSEVKFLGLLRILRLIKVMTEMKRVADANKAK
jgi:hypothetical protein